MNHRPSARLVPALLLLLTVLLLTLILASLGQRSLQRERELLLDLKNRQAQFIVRSVASAARISAMLPQAGFRQLNRFVNDTAEASDVAFIAVYDPDGNLLASSADFDQPVHGLTLPEITAHLKDADQVPFTEDFPGLGTIYMFLARFSPLDSTWLHLRMLEIPSVPGVTEPEPRDEFHRPYFALVGMQTADLEEAGRVGMRQALLNGFLLLLIGTIGFYFLILAHGYFSARRALSDARQYAIDVIDGMAEGLVNIDSNGILLSVNPEAENILGVKTREVAGKHWSEVFSGDEWQSLRRFLDSSMPFYDLEVHPGPSPRPHLSVTMIPVRGPTGTTGMALFLRDMREVTDLRTEVLRSERLAALGRLVAGMAHEIRNPLNSIRGFSQHLQHRFESGSSERKAVDIIVREVDRLNRVITELLDFSRPKEPRFEDIDLNGVVGSTLALVQSEAATLGVTCVQEPDPQPLHARGDADRIKQLLLNLLLNALQAMPEGGVLTVRTSREGGRAQLTVADTGVGITPEDQERIFEPFFTRRPTGTGLGLAIVHRIAQDHGAEIRVQSAPGAGTTFTIRFPEPKNFHAGASD